VPRGALQRPPRFAQALARVSSGGPADDLGTSPGGRAVHGFDLAAQHGQQHGAALLKPRDGLLFDPEPGSEVDLRAIESPAQVAQGHLLRDQFSGAGVDLVASLARQPCQLVLEACRHGPFPSQATQRVCIEDHI
jgi:hypothetical protein